jgi:hypothetical protein
MKTGRRTRVALAAAAAALACLLPAAGAQAGKVTIKTFTKGVGGSQGGVPILIPDGAGNLTQLVRSPINVSGLNPRGKIKHVTVGVRATHPFADDLEFYLASPRGVINLSHDVGGGANNYGAGVPSCAGIFTVFDSNNPTSILTPGLPAPFAGTFAPAESLALLNGLGDKKATNATWSLLVEDDDNDHPAGTLDCWSLTIKATNPKR